MNHEAGAPEVRPCVNLMAERPGDLIMKNLPGAVKRSGGPKTAGGKAASAYNALKSGVYAQNFFIDGENPEEFESLRQAVMMDLRPETVIQAYLAESVVKCVWRNHRLERYGSETLKNLQSKPIDIGEWIVELGIGYEERLRQAKRLTDEIVEKGVETYEQHLKRVRHVMELHPKNCPDLSAFKRDHPMVYLLLRTLELFPEKLDASIIKNELNSSGNGFWEESLKFAEKWALKWIDVFHSAELVNEAVTRILNKRIYRHLISGDTDRATDDVTRALHRALAEYYRERDRHRKDKAIVLDPEPEGLPEDGESDEISHADVARADAA